MRFCPSDTAETKRHRCGNVSVMVLVVLIVMGIQGSGKSEFVTPFVEAGYQRLNRDLLGGT